MIPSYQNDLTFLHVNSYNLDSMDPCSRHAMWLRRKVFRLLLLVDNNQRGTKLLVPMLRPTTSRVQKNVVINQHPLNVVINE